MPSIAKVLKTDVMADLDLRGIAQLLKGYGRGKDTMLAHITPEEARMLKERGGRGSINPETGLPEFDDTLLDIEAPYTGGAAPAVAPTTVETPVEQPIAAPVTVSGGPSAAPSAGTETAAPVASSGGATPSFGVLPAQDFGTAPTVAPTVREDGGGLMPPALATQAASTADVSKAITEAEGKPEQSAIDKLLSGLSSQDKLRLALGAGMGGLGLIQGRQASKQAAQAKQQLQDLAAPYQQQGQQLIAQAQRGELTPANQQALQAAAAQLQQGIANRGGVGVTQAANALANLQANMLQQQYSYGLQVAGIGDKYAQNAISVGLQQDREIASIMQGLATAFGGFAGSRPNAPAASA